MAVSCECPLQKGIFSLLQKRKTAVLGWRVNETFPWREEHSRSHARAIIFMDFYFTHIGSRRGMCERDNDKNDMSAAGVW
jgi:hypothetical protein